MTNDDRVSDSLPLSEAASTWLPSSDVSVDVLFYAPAVLDLVTRLSPSLVAIVSDKGTPLTTLTTEALDRGGIDAEVWELSDETPDRFLVCPKARVHTRASKSERPLSFAPKSVDLLVIDHTFDQNMMSELKEYWPQRLSKNSIVLIYGPKRLQEPEFLHNIRTKYKTLALSQGVGLEIVITGSEAEKNLQRPLSQKEIWKQILKRSGEAIYYKFNMDALKDAKALAQDTKNRLDVEVGRVNSLYEAHQSEIRRSARALSELHKFDITLSRVSGTLKRNHICLDDIGKIKDSIEEESDLRYNDIGIIIEKISNFANLEKKSAEYLNEINELHSRLKKSQEFSASLKEEIQNYGVELATVREDISTKKKAVAEAEVTSRRLAEDILEKSRYISKIEGELASKSNEVERQAFELARFAEEGSEMQKLVRVKSSQVANHDKSISKLKAEILKLNDEINEKDKIINYEQDRYARVMGSTSWRISSPVRVIGRIMKRGR